MLTNTPQLDSSTLQIDKLTRASIDLAQAASDYGALRVIFGCFVVMFLILLLLFVWQIFTLQRRVAKIEEASEKTLEYFSELNDHTIGKEEAKMIVREALQRSEAVVKYYILKIRLENHTTNKDFTSDKIRQLIDNEFARQRAFLGRFICLGHSVSFTATTEDNANIVKLMSDWVYKNGEDFTVSLMAQAVSLYYEGLRIKAQAKIDDMSEG